MARAIPLFEPRLPPGFLYEAEFLSEEEEVRLAREIDHVTFSDFEMRGVTAKRRVAFFGRSYDQGGIRTVPSLPDFLLPLRNRIGEWSGIEPAAFAMTLINQYPPGAPIGWHRDAPQYDMVAGVSLLSACRMKLRPYRRPASLSSDTGKRTATHEVQLDRRSVYLMRGPARADYEHHIPPVKALRYSITFRTLR